jgi:hypothetical protein
LPPNEQDLHNFLEDHIVSLQLVVEAQDAAAPSMAQDSLALVHDSCPPQLCASPIDHCSGVRTQPSFAPLERDGRLMVECGGSVAMPLFPRHGLKPHWVATVQISSSCGIPPPWPPLLVIAPSGRCPCDVHPKSQLEVRISCSGLVAGCYFIVAGNV